MDIKLFKIARQGKEDELRQMIEENPNLLEGKTSPRNNTALHIASKLGHTKFVEAICTQCPSLLQAPNRRGDTPLHVAARAGLSRVVDKLIECAERDSHLKEEMLKTVNNEDNTALHEAARKSHEVVHLLLTQQPELVHVINKDEASPLYIAAEGGCLESVKRILQEVNELPDETREVACRGPGKRTPLHAAVMLQRLDIAEELMMERKELARVKDTTGSYPLHYASALGNSKMVGIILQSDPSTGYLTKDDGQLPLHVAVRYGHIDVIKEFQRLCPDSCEAIDDRGRNALHFAVQSGSVEVVKHILSSCELRELINEPDHEGNTPLHLAIAEHKFSVFKLLVRDKRIDANVMNREGKTALDIAESEGKLLDRLHHKIFICKALIQLGGRRGLHPIDKAEEKLQYDSYKEVATILSMISGLIITVSFAAAFTIPGGFNSDGPNQGKATFARKSLLWLFIIADATSLFTAIYIALLLFFTAIGDMVESINLSLTFMRISLGSLIASFLFGLSLVLSKVLVMICIIIWLGIFMLFIYPTVSWVPGLVCYSFKLFFRDIARRLSNRSSPTCCSCPTTTENLPTDELPKDPNLLYVLDNKGKLAYRSFLKFFQFAHVVCPIFSGPNKDVERVHAKSNTASMG